VAEHPGVIRSRRLTRRRASGRHRAALHL